MKRRFPADFKHHSSVSFAFAFALAITYALTLSVRNLDAQVSIQVGAVTKTGPGTVTGQGNKTGQVAQTVQGAQAGQTIQIGPSAQGGQAGPGAQGKRLRQYGPGALGAGRQRGPSIMSAPGKLDAGQIARNAEATQREEQRIETELEAAIEQKRRKLAAQINRIWLDYDSQYPGIKTFYENGQNGSLPLPRRELSPVKLRIDQEIQRATGEIDKEVDQLNVEAQKRLNAL
jgi:hypothetical protein